jgi:hypothetical protein
MIASSHNFVRIDHFSFSKRVRDEEWGALGRRDVLKPFDPWALHAKIVCVLDVQLSITVAANLDVVGTVGEDIRTMIGCDELAIVVHDGVHVPSPRVPVIGILWNGEHRVLHPVMTFVNVLHSSALTGKHHPAKTPRNTLSTSIEWRHEMRVIAVGCAHEHALAMRRWVDGAKATYLSTTIDRSYSSVTVLVPSALTLTSSTRVLVCTVALAVILAKTSRIPAPASDHVSHVVRIRSFEFSGVGLSGMFTSMSGAVTAHMLSSLSERNDAV